VIDTLKLSKGLQSAGMTEAQADGITNALNQAQTDYVTKQDLTDVKKRLGAGNRKAARRIAAIYFIERW
jgi:hypothetical protein